MKTKRRGQSVIEYFVIMALILAAIISTDLMGRIRTGFEVYFNNAVARMR